MKKALFRTVMAATAIGLSLGFLGSTPASAAAPSDFANELEITMTASTALGTETLTNFPVLVRLGPSISGFFYDDFQSAGGGDLIFTDAARTTVLAHEVDTWDPDGTSFVWVKVPELAQGTTIYAYYGGLDSGVPSTNTWSDYAGVWHMGEDSGTAYDATANNLHGTPSGSKADLMVAYPNGVVGKARVNVSGTSYLSVPDYDALGLGGTFSISGWFLADSVAAYPRLFSRKDSYASTDGWEIEMSNGSTVKASARGASSRSVTIDTPDITVDWVHLVLVYNGTTLSCYTNGALSASGTIAAATDNGYPLSFGCDSDGTEAAFNGKYDEIRLIDGLASPVWVACEYATAADPAFLAYGTVKSTDSTWARIVAGPTLARDANGTVTLATTVAGTAGTTYNVFAVYNGTVTNVIQASWTPAAGSLTNDFLSTAAVSPGATYAVTLYVDNGISVAQSTAGETFLTGDVSVVKGDDADEAGCIPGSFLVSRPAGSGQQPLAVNYTMTSTTATPGVSYEIPAGAAVMSGNTVTGSVTIAAGATTATVSVVPKIDADLQADATITFALAAGLYGIDANAASASITLFNLVAPAGCNTWVAPAAGKASAPGNWSLGRTPIATDAILFDGSYSTANCEWDLANGGNVATVASWTQMANYTGAVTFNTTFAEADTTLTNFVITGDCVISNGVWTHPAATADTHATARDYYRLAVKVGGAMTLATNAQINLTGKGAWVTDNRTSYGGKGTHGEPFGNLLKPVNLGASYATVSTPANGGGALWLEVDGAIALEGQIKADGTVNGKHTGSGGSVFIHAKSMTGEGTISANGIPGTSTSAASGGRISILLTEAAALGVPETNLSAYGSYYTLKCAAAGTILIRTPTMANGRLIVREKADKYGNVYAQVGYATTVLPGEPWTFDSIAFGANGILYVPTGATLSLPNGLASVAAPALLGGARTGGILIDGGTLDVPPSAKHVIDGPWIFAPNGPFTFDRDVEVKNGGAIGVIRAWHPRTNEYARLDLTVNGNVSVDSSSYLLADDAGLASSGWGTKPESHFEGTPAGAHGGSYGNLEYTTANFGYDSIFNPTLPGNEGNGNPGWMGGGVLKLKVNGTLTLDGTASARGTSLATGQSGGHGTINIEAANLIGEGVITASGVDSGYGYTTSAANLTRFAGGGRVSVRLTDPTATFSDWWKANTVAHGTSWKWPSGSQIYHASAGTVYLQDGSQGGGAGTVYIAQNGSEVNWTTICTNDLTAFPSTRHGGENDSFRNASLDISGGAHVLIARDVRMQNLAVAEHSTIELNGNTVLVKNCILGDQRLGPGAYAASHDDVKDYVDDASADASGKLVVTGNATMFLIQ
ncbi:MAG: DUF2341 domain-containing protein [Kiritimatiellia bacterium]|jgi:hypothetical protein